jgi:hypothetical protein
MISQTLNRMGHQLAITLFGLKRLAICAEELPASHLIGKWRSVVSVELGNPLFR